MVVMDSPVSGRMADQNIDPNTTTSPSPIEKHVSAIKAISGDEKAPSKEKKNYASKKSTTVIQKSHCFQNLGHFEPLLLGFLCIGECLISEASLVFVCLLFLRFSLYNNIHPPTKWVSGSDLYCFKDKIEPKWEDPICANGGKWTMFFPRATLESNWLNTLLALVGEQFDQGDEICGAVLNFRTRGDRISLWTKKAANEEAQLSIGKQWKELLGYNDTIGFIVHEDAKTLDRDAKRRYTV
ncbi:unnamed protein product [Arabidopsis thaliana]|uniref:mRNA cap-binding protein n=1 Tax=Arabidopsis thaliana TaxID=3702 RepID=A0A7G2E086_ARATH|nr:unnamed protein product [Arabidopsis thaliana]